MSPHMLLISEEYPPAIGDADLSAILLDHAPRDGQHRQPDRFQRKETSIDMTIGAASVFWTLLAIR